MDEELSDAMLKEVCTTEQTQYFFETNEPSFRGTIDCENCTRLYHAEKLPKTNLVFIIADAKLTCSSCDTKPLIQDEQQSNGPDPCVLAQNPRYRKGPAVCFDNNEHEQDPDCGGASGLSPSLWLMLALQLVLLWAGFVELELVMVTCWGRLSTEASVEPSLARIVGGVSVGLSVSLP
ncbi:Voltage-dependent calcium channel subunit alpha-2/delta-1 [Liparis tanakae]|uniref:Voltage-dependent calcium channel subunit alpha-2/delta-1 n=1 Tax=Liparis tanakae TaxID=230148 RepID=A0A4Z2GQ20_9TELE|nr:Voltage-dependent calcium channel subunit alpha-2/delta-1 [Liparis tanakae]